jgi:hypothetical protein
MSSNKLDDILTVYVYQRPNLRNDEYTLYMGKFFITQLFDAPSVDLSGTEKIELQFPERWCNILEQRALYDAILYRCPNIQEIIIHTHSVYIIQCTKKQNVFIVQYSNVQTYNEVPYGLDVRYCPLSEVPGIRPSGCIEL